MKDALNFLRGIRSEIIGKAENVGMAVNLTEVT